MPPTWVRTQPDGVDGTVTGRMWPGHSSMPPSTDISKPTPASIAMSRITAA